MTVMGHCTFKSLHQVACNKHLLCGLHLQFQAASEKEGGNWETELSKWGNHDSTRRTLEKQHLFAHSRKPAHAHLLWSIIIIYSVAIKQKSYSAAIQVLLCNVGIHHLQGAGRQASTRLDGV